MQGSQGTSTTTDMATQLLVLRGHLLCHGRALEGSNTVFIKHYSNVVPGSAGEESSSPCMLGKCSNTRYPFRPNNSS